LNAAEFLQNAQQIVIVKRPGHNDEKAFLDSIRGMSLPNAIVQIIDSHSELPEAHPAHGKGLVDGRAAVYICQNQSCSLPITDSEGLETLLRGFG
jgi:hypothetical protein